LALPGNELNVEPWMETDAAVPVLMNTRCTDSP
jgi:hypothetical protein